MAFPYVSTSDDEKLENLLLSSFAENCNSGFERNDITYTDKCTVSGQDLYKWITWMLSMTWGLFGTQEFHRNCAGISQESVQFHRKNAGTRKNSRVPNGASVR